MADELVDLTHRTRADWMAVAIERGEQLDALRAEVAALKAELARFTEPLTDEQARAVLLVESTRPNHSAEEIVKQWDDDIREVRSK